MPPTKNGFMRFLVLVQYYHFCYWNFLSMVVISASVEGIWPCLQLWRCFTTHQMASSVLKPFVWEVKCFQRNHLRLPQPEWVRNDTNIFFNGGIAHTLVEIKGKIYLVIWEPERAIKEKDQFLNSQYPLTIVGKFSGKCIVPFIMCTTFSFI